MLLQDLSHFDLEWMIENESLCIRDFLDAKLAAYTKLALGDEVDIGPFIVDPPSLRMFTGCGEQDPKDEMVKCRECHEWYHFSHYKIKGRSDTCHKFWKCLTCRKHHLRGPTLETATMTELNEDNHFKDSENEVLA